MARISAESMSHFLTEKRSNSFSAVDLWKTEQASMAGSEPGSTTGPLKQ